MHAVTTHSGYRLAGSASPGLTHDRRIGSMEMEEDADTVWEEDGGTVFT